MSARLVYAAPADLSSGAAHGVHIVKMGAALRRLGLDVAICVKDAPSETDLARNFGLHDPLNVTRIPLLGLGPASLRFALGVLAQCGERTSVHTRHLMTAACTSRAGYSTLLELHSPIETLKERLLLKYFLSTSTSVGIVTITEALRLRFVEDFGFKIASKIHVLPDAADPVTLKKPVIKSRPTVGYVGSFLPGKGVDLILRIAAILPNVDFVLIGGPESSLLRTNGSSNVHFLGRLPHAEAIQEMSKFDIALLPNQTKVLVSGGKTDIGQWTSPLKMFEYMSACLPIVASRLPVLQEVLSDGRNSLLADPENPEEWALQIRSLLDNRVMAAGLAETAHQDFLNSYSWDARARRVIEVLQLRERP